MKFRKDIPFRISFLLLIVLFLISLFSQVPNYIFNPKAFTTFSHKTPNDSDYGEDVHKNTPNFFDIEKNSPLTTTAQFRNDPFKFSNNDSLNSKNVKVIPGGQSIGVQLQTLGVLVVGHHLVNGKDGLISPGEDASIKVGDIILEIDGEKIKNIEEVKPLVDQAGKKQSTLQVKIKRDKKIIDSILKPVMDEKEKRYRVGIYIRDSAAGIGTLSFYEPDSKKYGALGHVISDMDTKQPIEINKGTIVRSQVTSIEKGNSGEPGEKQAKFSLKDDHIGSITKNSPYGIFGKLSKGINNKFYDQPIPIALSHEIEEGPAKILTVVNGEEIEEFSIEIINNIPQKSPATKGMVIKITDKNLINKTGGIVQGMSGSPIIQNNKLVGAITHVFVNDPTSGYGVHIEWMLQDAGIEINQLTEKAS